MEISERRSAKRAIIDATVTEEYLSEKKKFKAINICEHGMHYSKPLGSKSCKGKEVFLTFSLLERLEPIKVLGWVVDERETKDSIETHVTFMFLPAKDESLIRDYIASQIKN